MNQEQIQAEDDQLITGDVARAVEERELIAYYQPVVDIETRSAVAAEALVRWTMPDGTIVPAGLFVPSLERTQTILGLDWYMVEEVCTDLEAHVDTPAYLPTSLNLSPRHAADPDFATKLAAMADWRHVPHDHICLEFRDVTSVNGNEALDELVKASLALGFRVTADNYSHGAAPLAILAERGITTVKVARNLWQEASVAELTELVEAAAAHGVTLSAESVEEESDLAKLREAGIRQAQGFLFAHPMDAAAFKEFCA